jgi:predicted protein tyrosine phosphatase
MSNVNVARSHAPPSLRMDGSIHVCPLSAVPDVVARSGASHLLTCLQYEIVVDTPARIKPNLHVRLHVDDISQPIAGYVEPNEQHVTKLLDFAHAWGGQGPMVIHCWAGISRSTAAAFISLCAINPEVPESLIAQRLRQASPTAFPNRLMVQLADEALARRGRMIEAVERIGRALPAHEAAPFWLAADMTEDGPY